MSVIRTRSRAVLVVALAALLVSGLAVAIAGSHKDYTDTSKRWEAAYNAGDAAGVAAIYTEDGVIMPPYTPAKKGRAAIEAFLKEDMAGAPGKLAIESVDHGQSGDLGYATGTWAMIDPDGNVVDQGKWMEVRKRVKGKWYILKDTWNSDMAPAAQ